MVNDLKRLNNKSHNKSVVAKQASDTLNLVLLNGRLVFTATITKIFSKMTKGQLIGLQKPEFHLNMQLKPSI